jgi:hypothetical protein
MRISRLIGISVSSRLISSLFFAASSYQQPRSPRRRLSMHPATCTRLVLSCLSSPPFPHKRRRITHPIRRESNSQTPRHAYPLYSLHKPAISSMKTPIIIPTIKRSEAKQSKEIRNVVTPLSRCVNLSAGGHRRAEQSPEVWGFCFCFR